MVLALLQSFKENEIKMNFILRMVGDQYELLILSGESFCRTCKLLWFPEALVLSGDLKSCVSTLGSV